MSKFLAAALQVVAVLGLDGVLDSGGDRVVGAQHGTLHKLDLAGQTALEPNTSAGLLPLPPCLCGAGLAPRIWRGGTVRGGAKFRSRVVGAAGGIDV